MPQFSFGHHPRLAIGFISVGIVTLLLAAVMVALVFFGNASVFELFVPAHVDAPDNWAIGLTRVFWTGSALLALGFASGGIGFLLLEGRIKW